MKDKDLTPTLFGYVIAYLLPGLAALVAVAFFLDPVANLLRSFATAQSSVGLFLFVLLLSLVIGMQLTALRWWVFENWLCKSWALTPEELSVLRTSEMVASFRLLIDEAYRYHQFFGSQVFVLPALFTGFVYRFHTSLSWQLVSLIGALFLILEIVTFKAAAEGWRRYVDRSRAFLKGGNDGNGFQEEKISEEVSKEGGKKRGQKGGKEGR